MRRILPESRKWRGTMRSISAFSGPCTSVTFHDEGKCSRKLRRTDGSRRRLRISTHTASPACGVPEFSSCRGRSDSPTCGVQPGRYCDSTLRKRGIGAAAAAMAARVQGRQGRHTVDAPQGPGRSPPPRQSEMHPLLSPEKRLVRHGLAVLGGQQCKTNSLTHTSTIPLSLRLTVLPSRRHTSTQAQTRRSSPRAELREHLVLVCTWTLHGHGACCSTERNLPASHRRHLRWRRRV